MEKFKERERESILHILRVSPLMTQSSSRRPLREIFLPFVLISITLLTSAFTQVEQVVQAHMHNNIISSYTTLLAIRADAFGHKYAWNATFYGFYNLPTFRPHSATHGERGWIVL